MKLLVELDVIDPSVSCEGCGACCTYVGTPPGYAMYFPWGGHSLPDFAKGTEDHERIMSMPHEVREELRLYYKAVEDGTTEDRSEDDTHCFWYEESTKRCRHHEWRPSICREFLVGGEDCLSVRERVGVKHADII